MENSLPNVEEEGLPDAWDEAEEETLLARVKDVKLENGADAEADIRRRDAVLLRDTDAFITRALAVAGEQKMLFKLDDQFEKFMSNHELQHIKINGVSDKQVMLIKAVSVLFRLRTMQSDNSICIHKTEESIVPSSRFGEPRNIAGAFYHCVLTTSRRPLCLRRCLFSVPSPASTLCIADGPRCLRAAPAAAAGHILQSLENIPCLQCSCRIPKLHRSVPLVNFLHACVRACVRVCACFRTQGRTVFLQCHGAF